MIYLEVFIVSVGMILISKAFSKVSFVPIFAIKIKRSRSKVSTVTTMVESTLFVRLVKNCLPFEGGFKGSIILLRISC